MTLVNCYATLAQVKAELNITTTTHDTTLDIAINGASRQIDGHCGWRFWQDGSVVAREFYALNYRCCDLLFQPESTDGAGISTTTGLIVKIDEDGDGTFETTLAITTDFILKPLNAADRVPVWPYTEVYLADNYRFPCLANGRPGVQVTAKFGWPAVPDDVTKACLIQAAQLFKAKDTAFDVADFGQEGPIRVGQPMNKLARGLLAPYRKVAVG